jgi:hypothetical protein
MVESIVPERVADWTVHPKRDNILEPGIRERIRESSEVWQMRFAAVLLMAGVGAMAQFRGGMMPGGGTPGAGNPGMNPGMRSPIGGTPTGIRGGAPFLPPPLFNPFPFPTFAQQLAMTVQGWPSPIGPLVTAPYPGPYSGIGYGDAYGYGGGGYYPPYPAPPQPANVTVVLPPPPPPPQIVPVPATPPRPPVPEPASVTPQPERVVPTEFPAVIAVRNGPIYSVSTYWTKGSTFHFVTTQGEHLQIPASSVERLIQAQKNGRSVAPKAR